MLKFKNLVTVPQYAVLCGISRPGVAKRIRKNYIKLIHISKIPFIDVELYPPYFCKKSRKIDLAGKINHPITLETISYKELKNLVVVRHLAERLDMRADYIYEQMLKGNVQPIMIGGMIFIDATKYPDELFLRGRKLKPRFNY